MDLQPIARTLALVGVIFLLLAGVMYLFSRFEIPLGKLPGDLVIKRDNFTCVFPIVTSLVVSIVLTLLINLLTGLLRK